MPITTVSAPLPEGTRPEIAGETSGVLAKRVATFGLCRPGARSMTVATFHDQVAAARRASDTDENDATGDPWFPIEERGSKAIRRARAACTGCLVRTECAVLAYREEVITGDVHGVRGGLSAGERRTVLRRFRKAAKDGAL